MQQVLQPDNFLQADNQPAEYKYIFEAGGYENSPDEEGIKTCFAGTIPVSFRYENSPDEEGIKTPREIQLSTRPYVMKTALMKKGLRRIVYGPVL